MRDAGTRFSTSKSIDLEDVHGLKFMKSYLHRRKSEEAESALGITQASGRFIRAVLSFIAASVGRSAVGVCRRRFLLLTRGRAIRDDCQCARMVRVMGVCRAGLASPT